MENLWSPSEVEGKTPLETLVYATRLLGGNPELVLWGGGNTSIKVTERDFLDREVRVLRVKATGANMATIDERGFAGVRLDDVLALRARGAMSDEEMVDFLDHTLMEPEGPRPSVETFLHAFVAEKVVLHSHANAILSLADTVEAERLIAEVYEGRIPAIGYVNSGLPLAQEVAAAYDAHPQAPGLILLRHGLVTWGETAEEAYRRHIEIVTKAEQFIQERKAGRAIFTPGPWALSSRASESDREGQKAERRQIAAQLLPTLQGLVSRREPYVIHYEDSDIVTAFVDSKEAAILSQVGPVTPDHMRYTKRVACYVPVDDPANLKGLVKALTEAVEAFEKEYIEYVEARNVHGLPMLDPAPRVILVPGVGMFTTGKSAEEARIARDVYTAGIQVIEGAKAVGEYASLTPDQAFDAEYSRLGYYRLGLKPK